MEQKAPRQTLFWNRPRREVRRRQRERLYPALAEGRDVGFHGVTVKKRPLRILLDNSCLRNILDSRRSPLRERGGFRVRKGHSERQRMRSIEKGLASYLLFEPRGFQAELLM